LYPLIRALLFALAPEPGHVLTLRLLDRASKHRVFTDVLAKSWGRRVPQLPIELMGLRFDNPVGLAAGFDKDACALPALSELGFGAIELGTVTPLPQEGNPKPRIFRIPSHSAIINRLGFNSVGISRFLQNLKRHKSKTILGINIGKNAQTPASRAAEDYCSGLHSVYDVADYVTINISSPNTAGLRELQGIEHLDDLLKTLKRDQTHLADKHGRYVPLAVKIAPDLDATEIAMMAACLIRNAIDCVIATNTTVQRPDLAGALEAKIEGGLSGPPLRSLSTGVIKAFYDIFQGEIPIIGVGGVDSAEAAWEKLEAGAEMVQLYTSLIYQGPAVIEKIVSGLMDRTSAVEAGTLSQTLAKIRSGHLQQPC